MDDPPTRSAPPGGPAAAAPPDPSAVRDPRPAVSFGRRISDLAEAHPDLPAVTCGGAELTRAELDASSNRLARRLAESGVTVGSMVTIAIPNSLEFLVATVAAWKLGAVPQPVSARLPRRELESVLALAEPRVVLATDDSLDRVEIGETVSIIAMSELWPSHLDAGPLEDAVSPAWKAPTSGGSTGTPKLIVAGDPGLIKAGTPPPLLLEADDCLVMPGPLYHNGPLVWTCQALLWGAHVVLLPRFDAEDTLAAIERHGAEVVYLVPTMMKRIWRLPDEVRDRFDLSTLRVVWHLAEPCPPWLKEAWIGWLGPERIVELYAGTEAQVATIITGTEWLAHRGSVGRPIRGEITIRDPAGRELPPNTEGEVWLRGSRRSPTYRYIGATARKLADGWESLGDFGRLDEDGYLYLGDRMVDMILTGGANVYPAEVEAAILEHPAVRSCAVIGLPDDDRGNAVHAILEAEPAQVGEEDLRSFLAERLVAYKIPRSIEYVDAPLRDDAGKVRRSELRAQRIARTAPTPD